MATAPNYQDRRQKQALVKTITSTAVDQAPTNALAAVAIAFAAEPYGLEVEAPKRRTEPLTPWELRNDLKPDTDESYQERIQAWQQRQAAYRSRLKTRACFLLDLANEIERGTA